MDLDKANKIKKLVNTIENASNYIDRLSNRSYPDEFSISYRGLETCDLEKPVLDLIVDYYTKEREKAQKELEKI